MKSHKILSLAIASLVFLLFLGCTSQPGPEIQPNNKTAPAINSDETSMPSNPDDDSPPPIPQDNLYPQQPVYPPQPNPVHGTDEIVFSDITRVDNDETKALFDIAKPDGSTVTIALGKGEAHFLPSGESIKIVQTIAGYTLNVKGATIAYKDGQKTLLIGQSLKLEDYEVKLRDILLPGEAENVTLEIRGSRKTYPYGSTIQIDGIQYKIERVYLGYSLNAKIVEFSRENRRFLSDVGEMKVFHFTQELPSYAKFVDASPRYSKPLDDGRLVLGVYSDEKTREDILTLAKGESISFGGKKIFLEDLKLLSWPSETYAVLSVDGVSRRIVRGEKLQVGLKYLVFEDVSAQSLSGIPRSEYAVFTHLKDGIPVKYEVLKVGDSLALKDGSKVKISEIIAGQFVNAIFVKITKDGKTTAIRVSSRL